MNIKKAFLWLDHSLLTILGAILIIVVPLYPKIPLADILPGYIVRVRLDDLLIAFSAACYLVQLIRRKIKLPPTKLLYLFGAYVIVGILSTLSAVFLTHTVTMEWQQLLKIALHLGRRIEYFSIFFVIYAGLRTRRDFRLFITIAFCSLIGAIIYGFGQKYVYWPAFSTMNREFSKGMRLYLTPTSRVMSTFGGHYDYAAYLMIGLGLTIPAMWLTRSRWLKILLTIISLGAYWSLLLTSSRTSFGGYIIGITLIAIIVAKMKGLRFIVGKYIAVMGVSLVLMFTVGDLSERFLQLFQSASTIHEYIPWVETGKIEEKIFQVKNVFLKMQNLKNLATKPVKEPPKNGVSVDDLAKVAVSSDIPPSPNKPLPPDVTQAQDDLRLQNLASASGTTTTDSGGGYSPNAIKYGLSAAIRLDALWPRAVAGFKQNPLLGIGYSTLTKASVDEFTQAESTDNDYLRMLGETGLLGTVSFLAILGYLAVVGYMYARSSDAMLDQIVGLGIIGAVVGLMVNAAYIDVFESSKVAYTLWSLAAVAVWLREERRKDQYVQKNK